MMKHIACAVLIASLAACSSAPALRLDMSQPQSTLKLRAAVSSAIIRTVSLPTYAAAEELAYETPDGLITTADTVLWADDPARAITLTLARHMDGILSADVGPEPWPFVGLPDVAIDVRITRMVAGADGIFDLEGQYYLGGDGIDYPNRTKAFAINKALPVAGPAGIASAQASAILTLSEDIARHLAR